MKKLHAAHVALSLGFFGAVGMLAASLFMRAGLGSELGSILSSMYPGYNLTNEGIVVGILYGFLDWFACGLVFSWIYNWVGSWIKK